MKKTLTAFFVVLFSLGVFGQTTQKVEPKGQELSPVKMFSGEEYMPYIFEPYRADYDFKGNIAGLNFKLFSFFTRIVELEDEWEETQFHRLPFSDEDFRDVMITSKIDLKTGLLKKMIVKTGKNITQTIEIGEGKIFITQTDGKKTKQISFDAKEKFYPCSYSNAFLSYLPLSDEFAASFACFSLNENDSGKPTIQFQKRTLRVVGTETVSTPAGTFECYKLADDMEKIKYDEDGNIKQKKKSDKPNFDEKKFWANFYNNMWIDKKTRKVVKAKLNFKIGSLTVELQPSNNTSI